jgi:tRNA/tmRNA/rRNA uracil-C5-methylase (TrmA/RlmC/RlmD family)
MGNRSSRKKEEKVQSSFKKMDGSNSPHENYTATQEEKREHMSSRLRDISG